MARPRSRSTLRLPRPASGPAPPPSYYGVHYEPDEGEDHQVVDVVEERADLLPVAAQLDADVAEQGHPWHASEHRVGGELPEAHLAEARGQRDERAHDRQHTAEEDDRGAVLVEPVLSRVEVMRPQQHVLAPAIHERPATVVTHRIGDPRADEVAGDAGHHDAEEGEGPLAHREPGERHDGLAGHRYAGALEEHEEEDRRQPPGADEVRRPLNDVVDEGLHAA